MRDNLVVTLGGQTYAVECPWGALPDGQKFGPVSQLAVDSQDRVYVFQRSNPPVLVFDSDGTLVKVYTHPGGGGGYASVMYYSTELDLAISILANSEMGFKGACGPEKPMNCIASEIFAAYSVNENP